MNIRTNLGKFVLIIAVILLSTKLLAQEGNSPDKNEWFDFVVEQYGVKVPLEKNHIVLDKAPFTLVLITREPIGVLVNCSEKDTLYKGFQNNKPMKEILKQPDMFMGIGEAPGNADEMFLIDEIAPHYLYYSDKNSHRFSSTELRNGYVIGKRVIANYTTYENDFKPIPINELIADVLYFSMMYSEYDDNYNVIELQKKAFKITFR